MRSASHANSLMSLTDYKVTIIETYVKPQLPNSSVLGLIVVFLLLGMNVLSGSWKGTSPNCGTGEAKPDFRER